MGKQKLVWYKKEKGIGEILLLYWSSSSCMGFLSRSGFNCRNTSRQRMLHGKQMPFPIHSTVGRLSPLLYGLEDISGIRGLAAVLKSSIKNFLWIETKIRLAWNLFKAMICMWAAPSPPRHLFSNLDVRAYRTWDECEKDWIKLS